MMGVCVAATRLEQLCLGDVVFCISPDASEDEAMPPLDEVFQHLDTLVIGSSYKSTIRSGTLLSMAASLCSHPCRRACGLSTS